MAAIITVSALTFGIATTAGVTIMPTATAGYCKADEKEDTNFCDAHSCPDGIDHRHIHDWSLQDDDYHSCRSCPNDPCEEPLGKALEALGLYPPVDTPPEKIVDQPSKP